MTARIITVRNELYSLLQSGLAADPCPFPLPFEIHRTYIPRHKPKDLTTRRLYIVPTDETSERAARGIFDEKYEISLAIQYKPAQSESEDDACDAQLALAEKIIDYLRKTRLPSDVAAFTSSQYAPLFDADIMDSDGILTTVFVITYQGFS